MPDVEVEVCVDSAHGARTALDAGARRLETCASLADGGLTPSLGLVRQIDSWGMGARQMVMIRPRAGGFQYSPDELDIMEHDIRCVAAAGCTSVAGFVFGVLTADRDVDTAAMTRLMAAAHPHPVTFHRAIDVARDYAAGFAAIARLGCRCVLTSGGCAKAVDGAERIGQMVARHGAEVDIMAGSGVGPDNALQLLATGVRMLHFSAKTRLAAQGAAGGVAMGAADDGESYNTVSGELVQRMLDTVRRAPRL